MMRRMVPLVALFPLACGGGSDGGTTPNPVPASVTIAVSGGTGDMTTVNETRQLAATVRAANGSVISGAQVTWTSLSPTVVSVSPATGATTTATALANGTAVVRAAAGAVLGNQSLRVALGSGGPFPTTATVIATTGLQFDPPSVDVAGGATVTWQFESVTHNVTFSGPNAPADIGNTTNASAARTFTAAGTFNYTCTLHAGMNGAVVVH